MLHSKQQIGTLDGKIVIEQPTYEIDAVSNERKITGWEEVAEVWAKVEDRQGYEAEQADQINAIRGTVFTIRYREIDTTWRIRFDGELYNIESVERQDRKRFLKVMAYIGQQFTEAET